MRLLISTLFLVCLALRAVAAAEFEALPDDPFFAQFKLRKAPTPSRLVQKGDRLAICGDSITEQKMYSRVIETYLTVCVPELAITVRQYGWGGETASGFLARMTNDCLRFKPTLATTCYGMNDHGYRPYEESIGQKYREKSTAIVKAFKAHGCGVIQGSPGCVGTKNQPNWDAAGVEAKNLNLATLRDLGIEIALSEKAGFADVFLPMLKAGWEGQKKFGPDFHIAGKDGVHPGWAGSFVMAYAFLKAMGLDGDLGVVTVDMQNYRAQATGGHRLTGQRYTQFDFESTRYPFCAASDTNSVDTIRAAMTLVPFNQELNRLMLVVKGGTAPRYRVGWGTWAKIYDAADLAKGVNLAADFEVNPFSDAFKQVDQAVKAKQDYETKQVKQIFHGAEGKADMKAAVARTEEERQKLADAIKAAFVPVKHQITVTVAN